MTDDEITKELKEEVFSIFYPFLLQEQAFFPYVELINKPLKEYVDDMITTDKLWGNSLQPEGDEIKTDLYRLLNWLREDALFPELPVGTPQEILEFYGTLKNKWFLYFNKTIRDSNLGIDWENRLIKE